MKRNPTETTGVHRRDAMLDALIRDGRPSSSVPPALPGERHRSLEEMAELLSVRARIQDVRGPAIVKASSSWSEVCKRRAQAMYAAAVQVTGGASAAADLESCDESTVRDRCHDPRRIPALWHALAGLSREALYELAKQICDYADEQEGARRVG